MTQSIWSKIQTTILNLLTFFLYDFSLNYLNGYYNAAQLFIFYRQKLKLQPLVATLLQVAVQPIVTMVIVVRTATVILTNPVKVVAKVKARKKVTRPAKQEKRKEGKK